MKLAILLVTTIGLLPAIAVVIMRCLGSFGFGFRWGNLSLEAKMNDDLWPVFAIGFGSALVMFGLWALLSNTK